MDYSYYISSFVEFADSALQNESTYNSLPDFCKCINKKGNELVYRALNDNNVDVLRLKKEMFQLEQKYVQTFSIKHNIDW
jgi:hypothetical protein